MGEQVADIADEPLTGTIATVSTHPW